MKVCAGVSHLSFGSPACAKTSALELVIVEVICAAEDGVFDQRCARARIIAERRWVDGDRAPTHNLQTLNRGGLRNAGMNVSAVAIRGDEHDGDAQ